MHYKYNELLLLLLLLLLLSSVIHTHIHDVSLVISQCTSSGIALTWVDLSPHSSQQIKQKERRKLGFPWALHPEQTPSLHIYKIIRDEYYHKWERSTQNTHKKTHYIQLQPIHKNSNLSSRCSRLIMFQYQSPGFWGLLHKMRSPQHGHNWKHFSRRGFRAG